MRRALRGAARILMAVAVLGGLARPGLAGPPAAPVPLSVSQAHWVEIHLELALLADEATFPGSCTVRVHNGQIELTGVIHSEAARARALRIANQFGTLPVRDGLTVQHKLPATPVSQAVVSEMASRQLLGRLGDQAKRVEVMVHDNNRVVLRGLVDSYEEKLFISRMLRGIAGCTAVQNELQVTPVFVAGRPYQRVSGDGKLAVAAGPATVPVTYVPAAPGTDSAAANPQRPGPVIYKAQSYPRLPTNLVKPEPASYATALAQDRAPQPVVQGEIFTALALPGARPLDGDAGQDSGHAVYTAAGSGTKNGVSGTGQQHPRPAGAQCTNPVQAASPGTRHRCCQHQRQLDHNADNPAGPVFARADPACPGT